MAQWLQLGSITTTLMAGLAVLVGASVVADRLGAPAWLIEFAALLLVAAAMALSAIINRTMRPSTYRIAGGELGWLRSSAPLFAASVGLIAISSPRGFEANAIVSVVAALLLIAGVFAAPLRRAGASGLGLFALARYRSKVLCAIGGVATIGVALLIACAAAQVAIDTLGQAFGLPPNIAVAAIAVMATVLVLPGGMASTAAGAVIALPIGIMGFGAPAALLAMQQDTSVTPALARLAATVEQSSIHPLVALAVAATLLYLGLVLPARKPGQARQTFAWVGLIVLAVMASGLLVVSSSRLMTEKLAGQTAERVPVTVYGPAARGLIQFCGVSPSDQTDLRQACFKRGVAEAIPAEQIVVQSGRSRWLTVSLGVPVIVSAIFGLVIPFCAIALFAAACRAAAASLVDELIDAPLDRQGTSSGRLALHRFGGLFAIAGVLVVVTQHSAWLDLLQSEPKWLYAVLTGLVCLPAIYILPARYAGADWRLVFALLMLSWLLGGLMTAGNLPATQQSAVLIIVGISAAAAVLPLLLPRSDAYTERAARIVAGGIREPIVSVRDA